jgi:hypothetical protein
MKLKLGLIVFLFVCLVVGNSAFAAYEWNKKVGDWNNATLWTTGTLPDGNGEVKIRYVESTCRLNSNENWAGSTMTEMRVYNNAVLNITGGSLNGPGWLRVGASDTATVNQSGGTLTLKTGSSYSRLVIGDSSSSNGRYNMTGGTITYATGDGFLIIGDRGGTGTFIVSGTDPNIQMRTLYVGGRSGSNNVGTLQYVIGAGGVSAITTNTSVILDTGGASSTANLVVSLPGSAPTGNILLVNNTSATAVSGSFDTLNGGSAIEGAAVVLGGNIYILTYMYDSVSGTVGTARSATYNDIALIPEPSITISTPPDTNTGDLLIAVVATDEDTSDSIAPVDQGWNEIDIDDYSGAVTLGAWWKLAGVSEPATHTFSWSVANPQQAYGWMMRFTGHYSANPINGTPATAGQTSATPTSPAVTTTVNNCLILRLGAFDGNDITVGNPGLSDPCHTTITMDESGGSAGGTVSGGAGLVKQAAIGSSGTSTFTLTASKDARMLTIAIAPDSTGGESQIRP